MAQFSIVIPVFNATQWLREGLDSVAAAARLLYAKNGMWSVEVVCVDDGSTDDSGTILDEYARRSEEQGLKFRIVHQANQGVGAARNAGLKVATGDYVCFLDPDDVLASGWFLNFARVIEDCAPDMVLARYWKFNEIRQLKEDHGFGNEDKLGERLEVCKGVAERRRLIRHFLVDGRSFVFAVKRSLLENVWFPQGIYLAEDVIFCVKVAARIESFVQTEYCGHGYRQHEKSLVNRKLDSRERLRFLQTFAELEDKVEGVDTSLTVWQMVQFWLVNAADYEMSVAIRDELKRLCKLGLFSIGRLPVPSRVGAGLFMRFPRRPRMVRFVHCAVYKVYHGFGGR